MPDNDEGNKGFTVTDRRSVRDEATTSAESGSPAEQGGESPKALPQIDFATFVMSLASSVLMHLGELSEPGEPSTPNLPMAKQTIDLLGMLEEKTRGNLSDEEARLLQHLLFDLRIKFVDVRKRA